MTQIVEHLLPQGRLWLVVGHRAVDACLVTPTELIYRRGATKTLAAFERQRAAQVDKLLARPRHRVPLAAITALEFVPLDALLRIDYLVGERARRCTIRGAGKQVFDLLTQALRDALRRPLTVAEVPMSFWDLAKPAFVVAAFDLLLGTVFVACSLQATAPRSGRAWLAWQIAHGIGPEGCVALTVLGLAGASWMYRRRRRLATDKQVVSVVGVSR